ncbi:restriction endonuclease subunit S [Pseudomonas coronafaciens]|uniref:restriction endonuclease subunit S n=1 Tax=Pseudomonas coronafaciens TaxID=53409 RepID=UPI00378B87C9
MTALLTDNLSLLAGAPGGINKLRELILDLAVRGKLVPQDPSDEPASELLKRIAKEKARLGKLKKHKPLTHIDENEAPFALPKSWQWARLGTLSELITSGSRDWAKHYSDDGAIFVRMGNLSRRSYALRLSSIQRVSPPQNGEGSRTKLESGDLLLSITGEVGLLGLIPEEFGEAYINQHVCLIRLLSPIRGRFLPEALRSPLAYQQYEAPQRGIKNSFRLSDVSQTLVPLPPLAEQHRIVAKIDELMALCDRLEARQSDAGSAHAQLVQALLDSLTQTSNATDFAANWQRLAEQFNILFTTEPSIDALKQTLLQLAVMGKLVPQDPNDEPASELLKQIAEEKTRLVSDGGLRTTAREDIPETEHYFTLHSGWAPCRLGNLARFIDYRGRTPTKTSSGVPLITAKNVRPGFISREPREFIADSEYLPWMTRGFPRVGDMLFTTEAPMGNVATIDITERFALAQRVICFQLHELGIGPFLKLAMMSSGFQAQLLAGATGMTATGIKSSRLKEIPVPIPPLAEQHRIVAKVDHLMALCDQLKTRLTQARQLNEKLASTLVARALADDGKQASGIKDLKSARTLLAAEVTHKLHTQRTFGQRKLQKVVYLAEHAARLDAIQATYLRNVAGPHDRHLMNQIEAELQKCQWYERIDRETVGHAYRPLSQAGQHRQAYNRTWSAKEQANIEQVIELMRDWDTDRCEMTVTLYAAWNDFVIEGRTVTDESIVDEVMHRWNEAKLRFSKDEWLAVLTEMKKHDLLTPTGFGKRTSGGMLTLPGFE